MDGHLFARPTAWSTQLKIKAISLETTQTQIRISLRENEITAVSTIIKEKHVTM